MITAERAFALICLLTSTIALFVVGNYATEKVGPDLIPRTWAILILLSSLGALVGSLKSSVAKTSGMALSSLLGLGLLAFYLYLVPTIGYFGSTFLFLVAFFVYLEKSERGLVPSFLKGTVVALCWNVFAFFVFFQLLGVQLPLNEIVEGWVY